MTSAEYRALLRGIGLSQAAASRMLGVHPASSRRWASKGGPSAPIARFLILVAALGLSDEHVNRTIADYYAARGGER
jgi:hypothetical protein